MVKYYFVVVILVLAAQFALAQSLPSVSVPSSLEMKNESDGGRILYGSVADVSSGQSAFKAGLRTLDGYFGNSMSLAGIVRSKDGATTIATFGATLDGVEVRGMATTEYNKVGESRVGFVFNTSRRFPKTAHAMEQDLSSLWNNVLAQSRPSSGSAIDFPSYRATSKAVSLSTLRSNDGTAAIGVASDYRVKVFTSGEFAATAGDGAYIFLNVPVSVYTPNGSYARQQTQIQAISHGRIKPVGVQIFAPYDSDPATAWKNMLDAASTAGNTPNPDPHVEFRGAVKSTSIGQRYGMSAGTITVNGQRFLFLADPVTSPPAPNGFWFIDLTVLACPFEKASTDMPALIAMDRSLKVNLATLQAKTDAAIAASWAQTNAFVKASNDARNRGFEQSMANQRAHEDSMERETAGMVKYIYGTTDVQNNVSGKRGTIDSAYASALTKADPQHFSVVPMSDYVKGVDY